MFSKDFWLDATERALRTFAQFFITLTGFSGVASDFRAIDWGMVLINSAIGFVLSIVMSMASTSGKGDKNSASLLK